MIEAKPLNPMIPDDLSIGGFHDTDMSTYPDPPLTTIRVPSRLIDNLDKGALECPPLLDAVLIVRRSTAHPAA